MKRIIFTIGAFLFFAAAANIFLFLFRQKETAIFFWDYAGYELLFSKSVQLLQEGIVPSLRALYASITLSEHSLIVPFIVAPLGILLGDGRDVYLFGVLNILALPSLVLLGLFFRRLVLTARPQLFILFIPMGIALLTPQFWAPIVRGYYDVAVLIVMISLWFFLAARGHQRIYTAFAAGWLLAFLVIVRRWTIFWAMSFFVAGGAMIALLRVRSDAAHILRVMNVRFLATSAFCAALLFIIVSPGNFYAIVNTNYSNAYQAYAMERSSLALVADALGSYGAASWLLTLGGLVIFLRRHPALAFFIILQTISTMVLFANVQRLETHHQYPLTLAIILFQSFLFYAVIAARVSLLIKSITVGLVVALLAVNFSYAVMPSLKSEKTFSFLFTPVRFYPLVRYDIPTIRALIEYLNTKADKNASFYVLASSSVLNDDILRNACRYESLESSVCARILQTYHIDARDGFPNHLFAADIVIVADPIQYHLRPEDQQVIGLPAGAILRHLGIGEAYEKIHVEFALDEGVYAYLYKKTKAVSADAIEDIYAMFIRQ